MADQEKQLAGDKDGIIFEEWRQSHQPQSKSQGFYSIAFIFRWMLLQISSSSLIFQQQQVQQILHLINIMRKLAELVVLVFLVWLTAAVCQKRKNQGGLSLVENSAINQYITYLDKERYNHQWHRSVRKLAKVIYSDPTIRYNWQYGISQAENLKNKSGKDVLDMLNAVLSVGPLYTNHSGNPYGSLTGFPIDAIFIHFMQNQNGRAVFSNSKVNKALKKVLNAYGRMLESPASLAYLSTQEPNGWFSRKALASAANYSLFQCDPSKPHYGFKSWHHWFLRQFKRGVRVVGAGSPLGVPQQDVIVSSCESEPLLHPQQPVRGVNATSPFWLKDELYSLTDIFGKRGIKKGYWSLFVGGTVLQSFLSTMSYHHWHSPVRGTVVDVYKIPGTYFYDQSQFYPFHNSSPDQCQTFLSATAAKMAMIIKADNPKIGYVGLVYIGMVECSGVWSRKKKGDRVEKGEDIGNFRFGGSSYTVMFQKSANLTFASDMFHTDEQGVRRSRVFNVNSFLAYVS